MDRAEQDFLNSESGAVTVDWVVLTASIVGLGLAVMAVASGGVEDLSRDIDGQLRTDHITTSFGGNEAFASGWGNFDLMNQFGRDQDWWDDWAANGNGKFPGDDNAAVLARYEAAYAGFHEGNDGWTPTEAIDGIGAAEAEMVARGMEIPEGNQTYADLYATMGG